MKILFLGDSITEGIPGVSYVDMVKRECELVIANRGKGGDTVSSLYRRVKGMDDLDHFDQIFVLVGVNDVFGKLTNVYKVFKQLRRQKWAKNIEHFTEQYKTMLEYLLSKNKKLILLPPLLLGEDLENMYNKQLKEMVDSISSLAKEYSLGYIDVYDSFRQRLIGKDISDYLPINLLQVYQDTKIKDVHTIDQISEDRGLHLTMDGVHLNSNGANLLANSIIDYIKKAKMID